MPYLEMKGIIKAFPGVVANDDVSFSIERGAIHALVGENGAGKSTLMRILYGLYQADAGNIYLEGDLAHIANPHDAIGLGIGMVHQEFQLVPSLSVAENIVLGHEPRRGIWVDREMTRKRVEELSERFGLAVDPDLPIREVSVGIQQRAEILKLLYREAQLLILDEPTAVLTPQEVDSLFEILKRLRDEGHSIILITHKLKEVMSVCQYATVLRRGKVVGTVEVAKSDEAEIARMMVGRDIERSRRERPPVGEAPRLVLDKVSAQTDQKLPALHSVSFTVHAGETVGIAGVEGNGQSELVEVLLGIRPSVGRIEMDGTHLSTYSPRQRREKGMAVVPEGRNTQGLNLLGTVSENLVANRYHIPPFSRYGIIALKEIVRFSRDMIARFDIRADGPDAVAGTLSGGNAQKIIIARELSEIPCVLVVAHPTRGLDIAASEYVRNEILRMRAERVAVLLISADLEELLAMADRILVLYEGKIVGEVNPETTTYEELGLLMAGHEAHG